MTALSKHEKFEKHLQKNVIQTSMGNKLKKMLL
jgi:hypothetical protein